MPEGPEIKVIVNNLILLFEENSVKKITKINITDRYAEDWGFLHKFTGQNVSNPIAYGKAIYIPLEKNDEVQYIKIHLMLSGHINTHQSEKNILELYFDDVVVGIEDRMHLAKVSITDALPETPNIFDITEQEFVDLFNSKPSRRISLVLVDQKMIMGIGSYLRSELLYEARINPFEIVKNVDLYHLYNIMTRLINKIVELGGSAKYEGNYDFKVYKRKVDPLDNNIEVEKKVYWVPELQK